MSYLPNTKISYFQDGLCNVCPDISQCVGLRKEAIQSAKHHPRHAESLIYNISFYDLRTKAGSGAEDNAQKHLGHARATTTKKVYERNQVW